MDRYCTSRTPTGGMSRNCSFTLYEDNDRPKRTFQPGMTKGRGLWRQMSLQDIRSLRSSTETNMLFNTIQGLDKGIRSRTRDTSESSDCDVDMHNFDYDNIGHWDARDFEDKLFDFLCDEAGRLQISKFKRVLTSTGLRVTDPRLQECMDNFAKLQKKQADGMVGDGDYFDQLTIDKLAFKECLTQNIVLISKAFKNQFVIPEFGEFKTYIDKLYYSCKENNSGATVTFEKISVNSTNSFLSEKQASYIPQLARYSPKLWGVSVCTVDGQRHSIGDTTIPFCVQSVSKPLTYALVHSDMGPEFTHQYVGQEPSGLSFNTIALDRNNKPHNPMINSGAIVTASLLKRELNSADKFDYAINMYKRMAGGEYTAFNNSVYLSEKDTADRNFSLGYYMRENKCFPEGSDLEKVLQFYFMLCSVEITAESGAVIAATLANGGFCPITGDKVLSSQAVRDTLSLMHSCGMYDYSGQFAFKVGLPAKSGVSGVVLLVIPNVMGICLWSPPLDEYGNSCRGIQFCQEFVQLFNFHNFDNIKHSSTKHDPRVRNTDSLAADVVSLLFSAYNGDVSALRRFALEGVDMNLQDYDGRTALHLAAAEGHEVVTQFLLEKCKVDPFLTDRWGNTALSEAKSAGDERVLKLIQDYIKTLENEENEDGELSKDGNGTTKDEIKSREA